MSARAYATALARWRRYVNPAVAIHRIRRPISAWLHTRHDLAVAKAYAKPLLDAAPPNPDACLVGVFGGRSGISRAAGYDVEYVQSRYPGADIVDVTHTRSRALARYAAARRRPPSVIVFLIQPNSVLKHLSGVDPAFLRAAYRIALGVYDVPCLPPSWAYIDTFFHEYWAPSRYGALALTQGSPHRKVSIIPHHVRVPTPPSPVTTSERRALQALAVMDLSFCPDRKNPWAHIEAWHKAFGGDPRFVLTIKARFSSRTSCIRREMREMIGSGTNISLIEAELDDEAMLDLQRSSDVGLSLHRAEGFGLTIYEMLALGKTVVATGWSGNMDFMSGHPRAYAVAYRHVPYRDYLRRYQNYEGTWAEADTDDAARILRMLAAQKMKAGPIEGSLTR